jgi:DNA polymerase-3 subunit delta
LATETKLRQLAQGGCPVYYFYSSERYLVRQAVARAAKLLAEGEDEETTVLDGAAPEIEQLIMAAGTISFFGTRRVVLLPEVDPAAYSDKDLDELCALTPEELLEQRYRRYRRIGVYEENGSIVRFTEH